MRYPMSLLALVALALAWHIDHGVVWGVATPTALTTLAIMLLGGISSSFWDRHQRLWFFLRKWTDRLLMWVLIGPLASWLLLGCIVTTLLVYLTGSHWWLTAQLSTVGVVFGTAIMLEDEVVLDQRESVDLAAR